MYMSVLFVTLVSVSLSGSFAADTAEPEAIGAGKKLIEWGWDEPSPSFMRENYAEMDTVGFDGVIFHAEPVREGKNVNFSWTCWGNQRFDYADFSQDVADLQACEFERMTDNFLRFNVCPGDVDWFDDDAFAIVVNNARLAARVANEGNCRGLMFDIEMYNNPLFTYGKQAHSDSKTFEQYCQKVRQRGREFMEAINAEYPDITVLLTFGYGITGVGGDRSKAAYGLLKDFLDGMFEVAAAETTIVDAYEGAYPFRTHAQFVDAYKAIKQGMTAYTAVPEAYREHVQAGFGIWMDMNWRKYGWHPENFERNYFTPREFEYSVFCGLEVTDRYVWIYTETPRWWTDEKLPEAYETAIRDARQPHVIGDDGYTGREIKGVEYTPPHAADQAGYSDEDTFGDLADRFDFVADLPKEWAFRKDPDGTGIEQRWFAADCDTSDWDNIEIGKFWDEQGIRQYTGDAWYRLNWAVPDVDVAGDEALVLWFGAADESATVWVNGVKVGEHAPPPDVGWNKRFAIEVTDVVRPGETNTIAVLVHNTKQAGGLWKSIKLAVGRASEGSGGGSEIRLVSVAVHVGAKRLDMP